MSGICVVWGGVNEYVCMACRGYFKVSIDSRDENIQWQYSEGPISSDSSAKFLFWQLDNPESTAYTKRFYNIIAETDIMQ